MILLSKISLYDKLILFYMTVIDSSYFYGFKYKMFLYE